MKKLLKQAALCLSSATFLIVCGDSGATESGGYSDSSGKTMEEKKGGLS